MTSTYREWSLPWADRVVACRWQQRIHGEVAGYVQRVVADGCADVIVIDGRHAFVVGPTAEAALPELGPQATVVGLRVRPEAIRAVFGMPGFELRDQNLPFDEVLGPPLARQVIDALLEPTAAGEGRLHGWLGESATRLDRRVTGVVGQLQGSRAIDVASVAATVGLSSRQLRRVVETETGLGPKTLQRIARLQRFLRLADSGPKGEGGARSRLAEWAFRAGYADQAHLAKDVADLAATTPARLVAERVD